MFPYSMNRLHCVCAGAPLQCIVECDEFNISYNWSALVHENFLIGTAKPKICRNNWAKVDLNFGTASFKVVLAP